MKKSAGLLVGLLLSAGAVCASTTWVPAVAHIDGDQGSRWRTDLAVLNLCHSEAVVEIRLHAGDDLFGETYVIPAGEQQIFTDVVAQLGGGETTGTIEIRSNVSVTVSSRTYDQAAEGSFGLGLDGVGTEEGLDAGGSSYLQQLREDGGFRTNIGAANMGGSLAVARLSFFDRNGGAVGELTLDIPAGRMVQLDRPFSSRFGRNDILGGYVRFTVEQGSGLYPYATVIDDETNDPTAVVGRPAPDCEKDIAAFLQSIDGMTVSEQATDHPGYRYFELHFDQPADHDAPDGETFQQYMTLLHRSYDAPMVLRTLGYRHRLGDRQAELTRLLGSNQLVVEHRFFEGSTPASGDWNLLEIRQAAADHHRIVEAIQPFYGGTWVNTGHSKGGMTAVFHRYFHPDDVDATVAYVAPISFAAPDDRYLDFVANAGSLECNQSLWNIQREVLERRDGMLALFEDHADSTGLTYQRMGGLEPAFESIVMEIPFTFWQYAGESYCSLIPPPTVSDETLFQFISDFVGWSIVADAFFAIYDGYFYQAHDQLGFPAVETSHLADLMAFDPPSPEAGVPPPGSNPDYDASAMLDVASWVAAGGLRIMFIYGENDPWTAGAFELGGAVDSHIFVDPGGTHGARIATLAEDDLADALEIIHRWTGVEPVLPESAKMADPDPFPPWRPSLQ